MPLVGSFQRRDFDTRGTTGEPDANLPGITAYLAIFDVLLIGPSTWVDGYRDCFATIGAHHVRGIICGAVAKGELIVDIHVVRIYGLVGINNGAPGPVGSPRSIHMIRRMVQTIRNDTEYGSIVAMTVPIPARA